MGAEATLGSQTLRMHAVRRPDARNDYRLSTFLFLGISTPSPELSSALLSSICVYTHILIHLYMRVSESKGYLICEVRIVKILLFRVLF